MSDIYVGLIFGAYAFVIFLTFPPGGVLVSTCTAKYIHVLYRKGVKYTPFNLTSASFSHEKAQKSSELISI